MTSKAIATGLIIAGVGLGNASVPRIEPEEPIQQLQCETNEVRFEEPHHKADNSIVEALGLHSDTKNQDIIDLFTEMSLVIKKTSNIKSKSSAVSEYYKRN